MAVTSETVRGGATRLVGAALAMSAAVGVSSAFGAACLGSDFSIAAWTQACTLGLAFSRQASRLPPPPFMQAITIGLPTLFRQPSITSLGLTAVAGAAARSSKAAAAIRRTIINNPRALEIAAFKTGLFDDQ